MRGRQKLYDDLIQPKPEPAGNGKRLFMAKRDEALTYRYYFYTVLIGYSYEKTLGLLEDEFYLSERAVIARLDANYNMLKDLLSEKPRVSQIKQKYPYYSWSA